MDLPIVRTSVFVYPYDIFGTSIRAISERISRLAGTRVKRIDVVTGKAYYCFVHFDQAMPEILWDMLSAGQETIQTAEGPIRISLNQSKGLDPNTTDHISQYMTTNDGSYWREFKTGVVHKMNAQFGWVLTHENPFVEIQEVEMDDDFTPAQDEEMGVSRKVKRKRVMSKEEIDIFQAIFV